MKIPKKEHVPYKMGADNKSNKRLANEAESNVIKVFKTPNSGAIDGLKTDFFVGEDAIDVKTAIKSNQIIIDVTMLSKLIKDAFSSGKKPVLLLNFPNSNLLYKQWVMRPMSESN